MNIKNNEYNQLVKYIKENLGINLGENKKAMVESRLRGVLAKKQITKFEDFYRKLTVEKDNEIETVLINCITTNYTYFMREAEHFEYFKNVVMPEIKSKSRTKDLRVWCAASSTGEEAYTLAMIIDDVLGEEKMKWDRKMLATDISMKVLEKCINGRYSKDAIEPLPNEWKRKYFRKVSSVESEVIDDIKQQILFRQFNLMTPKFPFKKKFNVIFCRNVMIYFDAETRNELINKFYDLLEPGGYLFIGQSETLEKNKNKFKYIMPSVYRKE